MEGNAGRLMSVKTALRSLVESDAEQKEKRNKDGNMERVEQILWREWSDVELNSERWDYMMKLPVRESLPEPVSASVYQCISHEIP